MDVRRYILMEAMLNIVTCILDLHLSVFFSPDYKSDEISFNIL